ncbi:helix-turn-helix domain-containing protein [Nocardia goodfellowii]|uniref:Transcriptional regulator with XRE-family HTH domain n=1 Tax=Nocardia goodfellowii TaxID=882446 RepID=A0ABS4QJ45_9NOCA|nr:helix-turn-helix transcriptional regulator [Nocardia goodfellowii]MBP2191737.1 transcriptional regulator with XRE-family HTH domain [Nocardia goodfellowii]
MSEVGSALRAARTAAGISLQGMAARTNYSKPYLGQLETGVRVVRAEHVAAYESALQTPLSHLRDRLTAEAVSEPDDLPSQLVSLLLPPAVQARGADARFTATELAAAEQLAMWARARQWTDGPAPRRAVLAWLTANLPRLQHLSAESRNARALRAGAELADLAAAMSWDVEDITAARRYSVAAARLAHAAGDAPLTAAILAASTWQLLDNGGPAEGLEVVQLAQYLARRTATPLLRVGLAELEAYVRAILGDRAAFQRALVVAVECRCQAAESAVGDTAADRSLIAVTTGMILGPRRDWPGPGRQWQLLGNSYRDLIATRPDLARRAFGDNPAPLPEEFVTPAVAAVSSARLQLILGEPEFAAERVGLAMSLCGRPTGRAAARLSDFWHESAEFAAVPAVGEVRSAIRELVAHR